MLFEKEGSLDSWADAYPVPMPTRSSKYVTSLYFVVATIGTIGFGDIAPVTTVEKVVCCLFENPFLRALRSIRRSSWFSQ